MPLASAIELPERYRVTRHIASGGMATVWEVEDLLLGRVVAVKVLGSHFAADPGARARFQREARTAARVSEHPHIATIYDTGEHGENTFIVMEYFSGGTVADRLRAAKDGGTAVAPETALRWLHEAALALDAAHAADIVHRDVKPANLLLDANDRLAVGDFGIARLADDTQMTQTGQVLGTAAYLSPEQALGKPATAASDRYALAVVAYELLTGQRPFAGGPVTAQARQHVEDEPEKATDAAPELPAAIDAVFARGLAKDPRDRPQTAVGLVEEIERALGTTAETVKVDSTRAMAPVLPVSEPPTPEPPAPEPPAPEPPASHGRPREAAAAAAAAAPAPAAPTDARPAPAPRQPPPAAPRVAADEGAHRRRKSAPWLPVGVAAAAIAAVVLAIVLASGGGGGGDGERASTTTPKKSTSSPSSNRQETPAAEAEQPAASPPPPSPPPAASTSGASPAKLNDQGYALIQAGDHDAAIPLLQRSVKGFRESGDRKSRNYSFAIYNLGTALVGAGRGAEAIPYLQERLDNFDDRDEIVAATLAEAQAQAGGESTGDAEKKPKRQRRRRVAPTGDSVAALALAPRHRGALRLGPGLVRGPAGRARVAVGGPGRLAQAHRAGGRGGQRWPGGRRAGRRASARGSRGLRLGRTVVAAASPAPAPSGALLVVEQRPDEHRGADDVHDEHERQGDELLCLGCDRHGPSLPTAGRRSAQFGAHPQQRQHGLGGMRALVALAAAGAGHRLLHVLHGHHAEAARHAGAQRDVLDAAGGLGADVVVVRRLAADDGAQAGDAGVAARLGGHQRGQRQLEGAGHVVDVDAVRAGLLEYRRRGGHEPLGELGVEAPDDDRIADLDGLCALAVTALVLGLRVLALLVVEHLLVDVEALMVQRVAHAVALGTQVVLVVRVGDVLDRDLLAHRQAVALQAADLLRVVREDADRAQAEVDEDLRPDAVVAQVGGQAELEVGLDGVQSALLQLVGPQLVEQADPAALLGEVQQDAVALALDHRQRRSSCSPQSQRSEWKTSPVRHSECTRTSTSALPSTSPLTSATWCLPPISSR